MFAACTSAEHYNLATRIMVDDTTREHGGGGGSSVRVAGLIGVVSSFDSDQEEWAEYAERREQYFIANDITDAAKQRVILLNAVGPSTYRLIKTLSLPETPKDHTFEELVSRVATHFSPNTL